MDPMNFGAALEALLAGKLVTREGWHLSGMFLTLQIPDENSKMTVPYIYLTIPAVSDEAGEVRVPWTASQSDLSALDWHEHTPEEEGQPAE